VFPSNALMPIIPGRGVMKMIVHPPIDPAGMFLCAKCVRDLACFLRVPYVFLSSFRLFPCFCHTLGLIALKPP
jgi:hypothetical protein